MWAMLAQCLFDLKKECAIYYQSKKMVTYESNNNPIEKTCMALVWECKNLRCYIVAFEMRLITRINPLKYLMKQFVLIGKTLRWVAFMKEFDINMSPRIH